MFERERSAHPFLRGRGKALSLEARRRCGEMADALDLKSRGPLKGRAGSSPATGTNRNLLIIRRLRQG